MVLGRRSRVVRTFSVSPKADADTVAQGKVSLFLRCQRRSWRWRWWPGIHTQSEVELPAPCLPPYELQHTYVGLLGAWGGKDWPVYNSLTEPRSSVLVVPEYREKHRSYTNQTTIISHKFSTQDISTLCLRYPSSSIGVPKPLLDWPWMHFEYHGFYGPLPIVHAPIVTSPSDQPTAVQPLDRRCVVPGTHLEEITAPHTLPSRTTIHTEWLPWWPVYHHQHQNLLYHQSQYWHGTANTSATGGW